MHLGFTCGRPIDLLGRPLTHGYRGLLSIRVGLQRTSDFAMSAISASERHPGISLPPISHPTLKQNPFAVYLGAADYQSY